MNNAALTSARRRATTYGNIDTPIITGTPKPVHTS
jgi:hypothetical protein